MRSVRRTLAACLTATATATAAAAVAGCGSGGYAPGGLTTIAGPPPAASPASAGVGAATALVSIRNLAFAPRTTTITVGQGVEWNNHDDVRHNVTTLDGVTIASPDLRPGGRFAYVPARAGRLRYYCTIHPSTMQGELIVLSRAPR